jgi:hypothetical protein
VQHQGVHYDTGTMFRGPGYAISTRRTALDMSVVRRELEIVRDDLHANAVRIVGSDLGPMTVVAEIALGLGLEVWFSPAFFEYPLEETGARLVAAALRTRAGCRQERDRAPATPQGRPRAAQQREAR